jgi:hypothetical protein
VIAARAVSQNAPAHRNLARKTQAAGARAGFLT